MKATKFTFKNNKSTGRFASFQGVCHDIKIKGKICGNIGERSHLLPDYKFEERFFIRLMIIDSTIPSGWRNIIFNKRFENIEDAKKWLNENFEAINKKWQLRLEEK